MSEPFKCPWCGKMRHKWSEWEQVVLTTDEWKRMCSYCARKRLRNPYNALLPMRKVEEE